MADEPVSEESSGEDQGPALGTVLEGRYELVDHLGQGGVGWVYRAKHLRLDTEVAIKMLQAPYAQHELLRPRFEREAQALAALRHPNIVSLTDYSIAADGHPYLVMELLEGRTLTELIGEGPVPEDRARRVLSGTLDALIYAHGRGFAHRDLKPGNIFLVELPTDPDHVKILDFGFVKLMGAAETESRPALTRSGIAFGTPSYMCPEQATGAPTDPRADLYAAGVVFFEMLAGRKPYVGEIPEVIRAHLTEPVPALSVGGAPIAASPPLRELFERAMAKAPGDRYQSAREMKSALEALPSPCTRPASGQLVTTDISIVEEHTEPATPAQVMKARAASEDSIRIPQKRGPLGCLFALVAVAAAVTLEGDDATDEQVPDRRLGNPDPALERACALGREVEGHQDVRTVHDAIDRVGEAAASPVVGGQHLAAVGDDLLLQRGNRRSGLIRVQTRVKHRHHFVFVHVASADPGLWRWSYSGRAPVPSRSSGNG